ncbi:hypothetical protein, partial [Pseudonocardia nigra]|uniref:hypothetical protein n=1 Tax=Pseudonocardia nigra TaxID=1921578 RepID=UPI001C5FDE65
YLVEKPALGRKHSTVPDRITAALSRAARRRRVPAPAGADAVTVQLAAADAPTERLQLDEIDTVRLRRPE